MNDLAVLFPTDDRTGQSSAGPRVDSAGLRRLVGESTAVVSTAPSARPRDLSAVVGGREPSEAVPAIDLSSLVGEKPAAVRSEVSGAGLASLVGTGVGRADERGWLAPELAQAGKRPLFGGRRKAGAVNYLSIVVAAVAVVALVGTASFAVIQRATANPADEAMVSLGEREAELRNDTNVLQTAADLFATTRTDAQALADSSAVVLAGLQGRVDAAPLAAAETARVNLAASASTTLPVEVPQYSRPSIDEKSLPAVAAAIDDVRLAREALPALLTRVRDARASVVAAVDAFRGELRAVGAAIDASATKEIDANDAAADSFRTAVADAATRVRVAQQAGGDGLSDMPSFAVAVDALRAENTRILALRAAEEDEADARSPQRTVDPPSSGGQQPSDPQPSDPPSTEPTTPPAPEPQPEPSPEPTTPVDPLPDPSDPPAEGGGDTA